MRARTQQALSFISEQPQVSTGTEARHVRAAETKLFLVVAKFMAFSPNIRFYHTCEYKEEYKRFSSHFKLISESVISSLAFYLDFASHINMLTTC